MPMVLQSTLQLKPGRKPLQPKNTLLDNQITTEPGIRKPNSKKPIRSPVVKDSNERNHDVVPFDASLADELISIKKKVERLRLDKEKTETMLNERNQVLDMQMKEIEERVQIQKNLEIEVDRLYRLNELKLYCMRISPIKSLRQKDREKTHVDLSISRDLETEALSECSSSATPQHSLIRD